MKTSYRERDYAYGTAMLTLRTEIGLTQESLANLLGVSRRAVGEWETGGSYLKVEHLKQLITLAVKLQAFSQGHEAEEIRTLWRVTRQKVLLDEAWLSSLLGQLSSPHLHIVPLSIEENVVNTLSGGLVSDKVTSPLPTAPELLVDWGDALAIPKFYGREEEQARLIQWIVQERCQVVSVLGMGGIGKSALAVNTMHHLTAVSVPSSGSRKAIGSCRLSTGEVYTPDPHESSGDALGTAACPCPFEVVIFRSLNDAPSCEALLAECLQVFSQQPPDELPAEHVQGMALVEQRLSLLLSYLRQVRALLVLDNLECLLDDKDIRGRFRPGFEGYGWLLRRVAETTHQSCLLLTSREKPADLRTLEGKHSPVHSLRLTGLDVAACQQLIEERGVVGSQQEQSQLIAAYSGNPLALKIVGETIVDLFGGEIGPFLADGPVIFGCITDLLAEQFARLSDLEQTVLYWLAVMREPVTFNELLLLLAYPPPRVQILEAIDALRQRSLIECGKRPGSFTLQSVVLEYVTAALIAEANREIQQHRLDRLIQHSLSLATASPYIRQTQERLLLAPLLAHLQSVYAKRSELEGQLLSLLEQLCQLPDYAQGYGPANINALLQKWRASFVGEAEDSRLV